MAFEVTASICLGLNSVLLMVLLLSFMLSICGQIGDLLLSALKRHYRIKDFSKLLPGHGGVLDRIDSLLINCMVAALFMALTFVS